MCRLGCWKRQKRRCKCTRDSHFNWWLCSFLWWHLAKSFKICGKGETQIIYKKDVEAKYQRRKIYSASKNKSTWKYNLFRPTKGINLNFLYIFKKNYDDYLKFDLINVHLFLSRLASLRQICQWATEIYITIDCQYQSSRQTLMYGVGKSGISLNQLKLKPKMWGDSLLAHCLRRIQSIWTKLTWNLALTMGKRSKDSFIRDELAN